MTSDSHRSQHTRTYGRLGIWHGALRAPEPQDLLELTDAVTELEDLGYGTIWSGGSPSPADVAPLLEATDHIKVATGILSIWHHPAEDVAAAAAAYESRYPGRFVLGLGVSHDALAPQYARPYSAMTDYLDVLDKAETPLPAERRVLAALGPKMLKLASARAAGAHPYLVTPAHTAQAREALGPDAFLAPELTVVLDPDLDEARAVARTMLTRYLPLPNYTNNLLRLGFTESDFENDGSDRLLDALFALGDEDRIRSKAEEFYAAGADHLALQVLPPAALPRTALPRTEWRALAKALL
ncbi:LLM class F420-dependent oxidoreductase [Streptomyces spiroverticillatus]|uniref:LLM class F420-dependent oxidoreductase n=1 Tax=Streptomyces finlayi TaxID=67296 RepID=A0A918WUN0_9ACTN|nr:LLM class F420-dependent oxidoreductase [Streptomyces finlayi]GGZ99944.1 LLM class F420-dependent oxidoreductase [Streptomyces spiroverticillatus]GHC84536.1 LLM class F420-dependent oxidoreductase [Streptomyces finlayi]